MNVIRLPLPIIQFLLRDSQYSKNNFNQTQVPIKCFDPVSSHSRDTRGIGSVNTTLHSLLFTRLV
ncbi:hypothetical protein BS78_02G230400 [Paspalum vaginatum]|nr:hypothetical protein BS78_02G230400 [Paspalum vaginatum]